MRVLRQSHGNAALSSGALRERTTFVLELSSFKLELRERQPGSGALFAYCFALKLASFRPELRECTPRTTFVLGSCEYRAAPAGPHVARHFCTYNCCDCPAGAAGAHFTLRRASQQERRDRRDLRRGHIRTVPQQERLAEGSPSSRHIRAAPQRESAISQQNGATARALRHARSPQRVRRAQDTFARRHSESASTRPISAKGSPSSRRICTAPQRERFDTRNPIATESSPSKEHLLRDTHDPRLRAHFHPAMLVHMSETLRLPRKRQTLLLTMLRLPRSPEQQRATYCARREKRMISVTECCAGNGIQPSTRRSIVGTAPQ